MSNLIQVKKMLYQNSLYPLHFLKPLEKAAIASLQSHKESIDISAHFSSVISVVLDQVFTVPHA